MNVSVLCYHAWHMNLTTLASDIRQLRKDGWTPLSLADLVRLYNQKKSRMSKGRYFHVTNDDESGSNEECAKILSAEKCPATFFLPVGLIAPERLEFYNKLERSGLIAVEDHSLMHRKAFLGPRLVEFYTGAVKSHGLERYDFHPGMPIVESGSEIGAPIFKVDEEVNAFCKEEAKSSNPKTDHLFQHRLATSLVSRGLASRLGKRIYVRGRFEAPSEFEDRIHDYLSSGRNAFNRAFGRMPVAFCFPFYQFNPKAMKILLRLGYKLAFGGEERQWQMRSAFVPRHSVDDTTPRPLRFKHSLFVSSIAMTAGMKKISKSVFFRVVR